MSRRAHGVFGMQGVQLVKSQPDKTVNCIAWSPQGHFLVLGGLKAMQGQLEFFNADDFEVSSWCGAVPAAQVSSLLV